MTLRIIRTCPLGRRETFGISCTREETAVDIAVVKRPRGPNAQCRVDLGFAGFSLSLTHPKPVRDTYKMRAFRRLRVYCPVFGSRSDIPPLPLPLPLPPPSRSYAAEAGARYGTPYPGRILSSPALFASRSLTYVRRVIVSVFHGSFFSRSFDDRIAYALKLAGPFTGKGKKDTFQKKRPYSFCPNHWEKKPFF